MVCLGFISENTMKSEVLNCDIFQLWHILYDWDYHHICFALTLYILSILLSFNQRSPCLEISVSRCRCLFPYVLPLALSIYLSLPTSLFLSFTLSLSFALSFDIYPSAIHLFSFCSHLYYIQSLYTSTPLSEINVWSAYMHHHYITVS